MAALLAVRGSDFDVSGTVYSTGTTPQDITGATITCMVKNNSTDLDAVAILTKTGSAVLAASGTYKVSFTAADTNTLQPQSYFIEVVVKLSGGQYIRNGENYLVLTQNVIKTLP